jgi:hypothetical protein
MAKEIWVKYGADIIIVLKFGAVITFFVAVIYVPPFGDKFSQFCNQIPWQSVWPFNVFIFTFLVSFPILTGIKYLLGPKVPPRNESMLAPKLGALLRRYDDFLDERLEKQLSKPGPMTR